MPIPGHNMTSATIGVFVSGSAGSDSTRAAPWPPIRAAIAHIAVTTNTAAAAASLSALLTAIVLLGKPDLSMILNGCLAGLVAITAPCALVSVGSSLVIGLIAGVLVVFAVLFFDGVRLDDPVGALSVHLVNGVFGTLWRRPVRRFVGRTGERSGQRPVLRRRLHPALGAAGRCRRRRAPTRS